MCFQSSILPLDGRTPTLNRERSTIKLALESSSQSDVILVDNDDDDDRDVSDSNDDGNGSVMDRDDDVDDVTTAGSLVIERGRMDDDTDGAMDAAMARASC